MVGESVHQEADEGPVSAKLCKMAVRRGRFRNCPIFSSRRYHLRVMCRRAHGPAGDDPAGRGFQR